MVWVQSISISLGMGDGTQRGTSRGGLSGLSSSSLGSWVGNIDTPLRFAMYLWRTA